VRVKKDFRFFVASNEPFNDTRLSWEARGVMGYLLSKPDGWIVRNGDLYKQSPAGVKKTKRILKELQDFGYLVRERIQNEDGTFDYESTVYESLSLNPTVVPKSVDGSRNHLLSTDGIKGNMKSGEVEKSGNDKTSKENQCASRLNSPAANEKYYSTEILFFYDVSGFYPEDDDIPAVTEKIKSEHCTREWIHDRLSLELYRGNVGIKKRRDVKWILDDSAESMLYYLDKPNERAFLQIPCDYDLSICGGVSKNPAIMAYKNTVGIWPCRQLYGRIANRWDGFDYDYLLDEFGKRRGAWLEHGYSKTSYGWLFDEWPSFRFRVVKEPLTGEELEPAFLGEEINA